MSGKLPKSGNTIRYDNGIGGVSLKKQIGIDILCYITGSACFALSVSVFSTPNDIAPGGTAGVGIMAHALFDVPVGMVVLLLNLPLLAASFVMLGRRYTLRSAAVIVLSSVIMDVTAPLLPAFRGERLLAALCGGLLSGVGIGLIMLRGACTGGSDIAAGLLQKHRPHLSLGRLILGVDAAVIALSVVVFGELEAALYAAIQVFVSSLMIDHILYGREEGRLLLVVTSEAASLAKAVTVRMSRGVTVVEARGGYTGDTKGLLLCAVSRTQLPALKKVVLETDPSAFAMIVTTEQVMGLGFFVGKSGGN